MRSAELAQRFERTGMPRSYLDGVMGLTPGYRCSQVHGTERVRVEVVEDEQGMLGTVLARLCDLWGYDVAPLSVNLFEVTDPPIENRDENDA